MVQIARLLTALVACLLVPVVSAEPYFAVSKGLQCSACHSHPAGGGLRTAYGNAFAQMELPSQPDGNVEVWTGRVSQWLSVGANLRSEYRFVETPDQPDLSEFDVSRATLYLQADPLPGRLSVYIDQQLAPGGSLNREAYVRVRESSGRWQLVAGQFFLPYGLRLQDDSAFVRQFTGVNFNTPDRGVQLILEGGPWSTVLALTNGSGGGSETDTGKQASFVANYVASFGRVGLSVNINDSDAGDRQMGNLFGGLRTGPIAWLAEVDWIRDDLPTGATQDSLAGLVEANWQFRQGHNLKFSYDYHDPDTDISENHEVRYSVVWEYSPFRLLQGRAGVRSYDGVPQANAKNRDELFVELHAYF